MRRWRGSPNDTPFPVEKAHELYSKLFGPADRLIAEARSLIIVPDGALEAGRLPFW